MLLQLSYIAKKYLTSYYLSGFLSTYSYVFEENNLIYIYIYIYTPSQYIYQARHHIIHSAYEASISLFFAG